jgi:hypothetical protein
LGSEAGALRNCGTAELGVLLDGMLYVEGAVGVNFRIVERLMEDLTVSATKEASLCRGEVAGDVGTRDGFLVGEGVLCDSDTRFFRLVVLVVDLVLGRVLCDGGTLVRVLGGLVSRGYICTTVYAVCGSASHGYFGFIVLVVELVLIVPIEALDWRCDSVLDGMDALCHRPGVGGVCGRLLLGPMSHHRDDHPWFGCGGSFGRCFRGWVVVRSGFAMLGMLSRGRVRATARCRLRRLLAA